MNNIGGVLPASSSDYLRYEARESSYCELRYEVAQYRGRGRRPAIVHKICRIPRLDWRGRPYGGCAVYPVRYQYGPGAIQVTGWPMIPRATVVTLTADIAEAIAQGLNETHQATKAAKARLVKTYKAEMVALKQKKDRLFAPVQRPPVLTPTPPVPVPTTPPRVPTPTPPTLVVMLVEPLFPEMPPDVRLVCPPLDVTFVAPPIAWLPPALAFVVPPRA
jgi:hypothetical protein